jgi:hypothetical protein
MKKELCLPTETFLALTKRMERQQQALDEARERLSSISKEKADNQREKQEWERFHHGIVTTRDLLARSAQQDVDLAHAMVDIEEVLDIVRERGVWYEETGSDLHSQYLAASSAAATIRFEVDMIEAILSRAYCEGAVEGMPVED